MYEQFFGLTETPFTRHIPVTHLYGSQAHEELVARMQYVVQTRGFGVVTGEIGSGKSTAIRALFRKLDGSRYRLLYLSDANPNPRSFYRALLEQLGLKPAFQRADGKRQLDTALMELWETQRRQTVVVIDEAHLLSPAMLEEVRFLTNHQMDSTSPLSLLLVGQPELGRKLTLQAFEAVRQRITLRYHLEGLKLDDTKAYIQHHLTVAGAARPLFGEEAIRLIYQRTRGIPREVNNVCSACLLAAFAEQRSVVDEATVKTVLAEFPEH
jgi:type II secretory pathway predicted ATPase ExeA